MALITCPECGKSISDRAAVCVHCGFPIRETSREKQNDGITAETSPEEIPFRESNEQVSAGSELSEYEGLRISEIMPSNQSAVRDDKGSYSDWVEIWNSSGREISLYGIGLSDSGDKVCFLFPDVTLEADARIVVFCDNTNQTNSESPLHAKFRLSSAGETVYLYDPHAILIDSCKYPIMADDESWVLTSEGFQSADWYSPGYENNEAGHRQYLESIQN